LNPVTEEKIEVCLLGISVLQTSAASAHHRCR